MQEFEWALYGRRELSIELPEAGGKHVHVMHTERHMTLAEILRDLVWHLETGEPFPEYD